MALKPEQRVEYDKMPYSDKVQATFKDPVPSFNFIVKLEGDLVQYGPDIRRFVDAMVYKLGCNVHKGRWEGLKETESVGLLQKEVVELQEAVLGGNMVEIMLEAADVANFALITAAIAMEKK